MQDFKLLYIGKLVNVRDSGLRVRLQNTPPFTTSKKDSSLAMEQEGKGAGKVIQTRQKSVFLAGETVRLLHRFIRAEFFPDVHTEGLFTVSSAWSEHGTIQLLHPPFPHACLLGLCCSAQVNSFTTFPCVMVSVPPGKPLLNSGEFCNCLLL